MKLVITGASGLVGKAFINAFNGKYEIVSLSRTDRNKLNNKSKWIKTDYTEDSLSSIFCVEKPDAILHLASVRPIRGNISFTENVSVDENLYKAAKKNYINNVVTSSSRSVYGEQQVPWTEDTDVSPMSDYALSKVMSESLGLYCNRMFNMNIKLLRIAQVLSDKEYEGGLLHSFFSRAGLNLPLFVSVKGISREYIYIKDLISALDVAINLPEKKGLYNLGTGESVTIEMLANAISTAYKSNVVQLAKEVKIINETSLMDSTLFMNEFNWKPKYNVQQACEDIYKEVNNV